MSKDIKKEFLPFWFSELDAVSRRFEKRAAEGWMLKKLDTTCVYERCRPQNVRFCVALCPTAEAGANEINERSREFISFCEEAGWKFVGHVGQSYAFRTSDMSIPDIETDDRERVAAVRRAGREYRMLLTLPIGICALNAVSQLIQVITGPRDVLRIALMIFHTLAFLVALAGFLANRKMENDWCDKALECINAGEPIPPSGEKELKARRGIAVLGIVTVALLALGLYAVAMIKGDAPIRASLLAMPLAAVPAAILIPPLSRMKRSAKKTVLTVLLIVGLLLLFVLLFAVFGSVLHAFEEIAA